MASNLAGKNKFKVTRSNEDKVIDPKTTKQCSTDQSGSGKVWEKIPGSRLGLGRV